jgi:hypothetical protein
MKAAISEESFDQVFSKLESALDWIVFLTNDNEADRHQIEPDHLKRAVLSPPYFSFLSFHLPTLNTTLLYQQMGD